MLFEICKNLQKKLQQTLVCPKSLHYYPNFMKHLSIEIAIFSKKWSKKIVTS